MALQDALLQIADDMEKDANDPSAQGTFTKQYLQSYAKLIRTALKASEGSVQQNQVPIEKINWEREAHQEFRKKNTERTTMVDREDGFLGNQMEIADGPLGGSDGLPTFGEVPPGGSIGCKTVIGGCVYEIGADKRLYYVEDETKQLKVKPKESSILLGS